MAKRLKLNKLENRVVEFKPKKDEKGRYIDYCDFGFHQGVPTSPEHCLEKGCNHYKRLYIPK